MQDLVQDRLSGVQPETWSPAEEALQGHLEDGEAVLISVGAMLRVALQFFDRCELVLTDRRLIVLKPSWPWGFKFERDFARSACSVRRHKKRVDGSQLLVVHVDGDDICFYVPRRSRDGGVTILEALR